MKILSFAVSFLFLSVCFADQAFITAIESDNVPAIRTAIETGKLDKNAKLTASPYGAKGMPLIAVAARAGAENVAYYLISKKIDLDAQTSIGETALMLAVFFDASYWNQIGHDVNDRIAKALIDAGASLENGDGWGPMAYAAYPGRLDIIKYMVSKGANVNGPIVDGVAPVNTPLMMASMQGKLDVARYLLIKGADVRVKAANGHTAASLAKKYNNRKLLSYLVCAEKLAPGESYEEKCE